MLANNCTDGTAEVARRADPAAEVLEMGLPPHRANAGGARRAAMDAAAARLPEDGLICSTDADSRARPDWAARLQSGLAQGAGAVAGAVDLDLPPDDPTWGAFSPSRRLEAAYSALQAELAARLDPDPHDPWPNHLWAWGASFAVTRAVYLAVGGLPEAPLAEDRAFFDALRRRDIPVRHCLRPRVWTSARPVGRAPGGLADLIADHAGGDLAPCDAALEPAFDAARRAIAHRRFLRSRGREERRPSWAPRLALPARLAAEALAASYAGEGWARLEAASPVLARRRLIPADLPREIARAERLLARLRPDGVDRSGSALAAGSGLWSAAPPPP